MKKKRSKRLLSLLLSLTMLLTLTVTPMYAADTDDSTTEAITVESTDEITGLMETASMEETQVTEEALTVDYVIEDEVNSEEENGIMLLSVEADEETAESFVAKIGSTTYSTLTAAINAAGEGDTIVLGSDVTETIGISSGKDVTIDLAGHTISSATDSTTRLITMRGGKLTITDSADGGTITSGVGDAVILIAGGTLVVNGGTISATGSIPAIVNAWQSGNYAEEASTVIVNGGTVTAAGAPAIRNNAAGCSITVNGGEIVGYSDSTGYYIVDSVSEANSGSVVITGGYFTTNDTSASQILFYQKNSGNIVISGGYFNNAISWINSAMRATGYSNTELDTAVTYNDVEYKYTVATSTVLYGTISDDGDVTYLGSAATPQKAVNALKSASVSDTMYIELAADVSSTVDVGTGSGTSVVLELNGYDIVGGDSAAIVVQDGVILTVRDSEGTSEISSDYSNGTIRNRGGVLNIEGGIYTNTSGCVLQNNGSNDATDTTYITTIYGGTFTGTFSVVKGSVTAYAGITDNSSATTYYATLEEAVSAAEDEDTVTLYSDVEVDSAVIVSGKSITLDLNGCTVSRGTCTYTYLIGVVSGASLTVQDTSSNADGKIDATFVLDGTTYASYGILTNGSLIVTSGTVTGYRGIVVSGDSASLSLNGGTVNGGYYGVYQSGGTVTVSGGTVSGTRAIYGNAGTLKVSGGTVTGSQMGLSIGGTLTANISDDAVVTTSESSSTTWAVYLWQDSYTGTTTISGGTIGGEYTKYGVTAYGGTADVTGGTITATGAAFIVAAVGTIGTISGDNTVITAEYAAEAFSGASLTINGGKLTATGDDSCGVYVGEGYAENYTTLTITGGEITANSIGVCTNGSQNYTKIVMSGGTITAPYGMYLPAMNSTTEITGGTITASATAIEIRAGELTVSGGQISSTSETFSYTSNGSGTTVIGAGIAISQHSTNQTVKVTITGGTISGIYGVFEVNTYSTSTSDVSLSISGDSTSVSGTAKAVYSVSLSGDVEGLVEGVTTYPSSVTTVDISGGTYSTEVDPEYCADGYTPDATTTESGTTYGVTKFYLGISENTTNVPATIMSEEKGIMYVKVSASNISSNYSTSAYPTTERTWTSTDSSDSGNYIFAGWYSYDSGTYSPMTSFPTTDAYAKFVEANTMSIKGVVMKSVTSGDAEGTKYWRIVTGLDSLNYDYIGFEVYMGNNEQMTTISGYYWIDYTATTANRKFVASEFGTCSKYISVCLVSEADSATSCQVRSCWTTLDGTTVYGAWYNCDYTDGTYELNVVEVSANE